MRYVGFSSPSVPIVEPNCKLEVVPEKIQAVWHQIALSEGTTTHEKEQMAKPVMAGGLCPSPSFVLPGPFRTLPSNAAFCVSWSFVGVSQGRI